MDTGAGHSHLSCYCQDFVYCSLPCLSQLLRKIKAFCDVLNGQGLQFHFAWWSCCPPVCMLVLLSPPWPSAVHKHLVSNEENRWPSQGLICIEAIETTKAVPEEDGIGSHGRFVKLSQSKTQCRALFLPPFQKPLTIPPSTDRGHSVSLLSTARRPKGCEKEDVFERGRSLLASW